MAGLQLFIVIGCNSLLLVDTTQQVARTVFRSHFKKPASKGAGNVAVNIDRAHTFHCKLHRPRPLLIQIPFLLQTVAINLCISHYCMLQ